ncbi:unnamed protein product [Effrenium voratum]|uniref:SET domain-containing protein n=1 Tax=Effrenium voratum TaxID=2562239 RepID=A0AA36JAM5_9DINO|nr:unnamed protein product [Effrenium voratum]
MARVGRVARALTLGFAVALALHRAFARSPGGRLRLQAVRNVPKSFFDAETLEQREMPSTLSDSARKAIEATEVDQNPRLAVREIYCARSTVHGWGLFAGRDFQKGELLHESPGRLIEGQPSCITDDVFATSEILWEDEAKNYSILGLGFASLHNHAEDPNTDFAWEQRREHGRRLVGRFWTLRQVRKDEELFISYGPQWFTSRNLTAKAA